MMGIIIVVLLGALSGILSLWMTIYFFSPRIKLSSNAVHTPNAQSRYEYSVKYHNIGWRTAIELNFRIMIIINGMRLPESNNIYLYQLDSVDINTYRCMAMGNTIVRFSAVLPESQLRNIQIHTKENIETLSSGDLSRMLKLGEEAYLQSQLIASDGRTGFRRYFCSEKIYRDDIIDSSEAAFYYDDAEIYRKTENKGHIEYKYPKFDRDHLSGNVFIVKVVRCFTDFSQSHFERYKRNR